MTHTPDNDSSPVPSVLRDTCTVVLSLLIAAAITLAVIVVLLVTILSISHF